MGSIRSIQAWVVVAIVLLGCHTNTSLAQNDFKKGDEVEFYHGGSAYIIRTRIQKIEKNGNIYVRYETPFEKFGSTSKSAPPKYFWRAGDEPNPAPDNEFKLGDEVEFYYSHTDRVAFGVVTNISPGGLRYTIYYPVRGGNTRRDSVQVDAVWLKGAEKKPLPKFYRKVEPLGSVYAFEKAKPKPFREWTAGGGKFTLNARFVSAPKKSVELEKEDGSTITVELSKISEADREYVADILKNSTARRRVQGDPVIPFSKNRLKLKPGQWDFKYEPDEKADYSLPQNDVAMAEPVGFGARREGFYDWTPLALGEDPETFESRDVTYKFSQWVMAQDGRRCFLAANSYREASLIQGFDFISGELEFAELIDGRTLAISQDGSKVAFAQTYQGFGRGELIVKEIGIDGKVLQRRVIKSFADDEGYNPQAGYFMNDSVLVTVGRRIVAFDIDKGTGYSTTPFPKDARLLDFAISPNRKHIAMASAGGIFLYDVARGKPIGAIRTDLTYWTKMAFSPDGTKLVVSTDIRGVLKLFDLKTGEQIGDTIYHGKWIKDSLAWAHPRFILIDYKHAFDLELGVFLWEFKPKGDFFNPIFYMGGNTFMINDGNLRLSPVGYPMERIANEASSLSLEDAVVLEKGDSYAINLSTGFDQRDNDKIIESFQRQLDFRGLTYDENSQNIFYCTVDYGNEKTTKIRMKKDDFRAIRYTPSTCSIELEIDGVLKWNHKRVNTLGGGTLYGQRGESPQQAADRICRPKVSNFTTVGFPNKFILFPNGKAILGSSVIDRDGVTDDE